MARIKTWGLFSGRLLSDMKLWVLHPRWTVLFYSVFNETFLPVVCCEDLVALINAVFSTTSVSFTLGMFPGLPVEVDVSSVSAHPSHVPDMAVRFSLLYPGCAKRPTLLWKLKEPKGSQWMPKHVQQMYSTHCLPKTLPHLDAVPQVVSTDLALWLITTCIAINSDSNFTLLKQRMSWEKFLELQFSAEGWVFWYFSWIYVASVQKWKQENVGWEQWYKSVRTSVQVERISRYNLLYPLI